MLCNLSLKSVLQIYLRGAKTIRSTHSQQWQPWHPTGWRDLLIFQEILERHREAQKPSLFILFFHNWETSSPRVEALLIRFCWYIHHYTSNIINTYINTNPSEALRRIVTCLQLHALSHGSGSHHRRACWPNCLEYLSNAMRKVKSHQNS